MTGIVWKNQFNCEPKPESWIMEVTMTVCCIFLLVLTYTLEPYILPYLFGEAWNTQKDLVVIQDAYNWKRKDYTTDDTAIDGSFEIVPGLTANEYVERINTETFFNEDTGETFEARLPPSPEEYYECEFNNNEWVLPDRSVFRKMVAAMNRQKRGEITERELDILLCKIIVEDLDKQEHRTVVRPNRKRFVENPDTTVTTVTANEIISEPEGLQDHPRC